MGQTLGEPITKKETSSCADSTYKVGSSCMQGWRINMEDAHTHILSLPDDSASAFFAVYDGHGGDKVSQYASMHLHKKIVGHPAYGKGDVETALKSGFLSLDEQMLSDEDTKEEMSGTTATTILIKNSTIYCANVGDSRAVASVNGHALALSYDHKPCNEEETARITAAGGWVEFNRVNGNLALSRALGDFGFKQNEDMSAEEQIVTANPEILKFELTQDFEFILLACDGIWDVMSNQEAIDFCREGLLRGKLPETVCEELLDKCLAPDCELSGIGCDNMTVVLVALLQGEPYERFQKRLQNAPSVTTTTTAAVVESVSEEDLRKSESNNNVSVESSLTVAASATTEEQCTADELFSTPSQSPNPAHEFSGASSGFKVPSISAQGDEPGSVNDEVAYLDGSKDSKAAKSSNEVTSSSPSNTSSPTIPPTK